MRDDMEIVVIFPVVIYSPEEEDLLRADAGVDMREHVQALEPGLLLRLEAGSLVSS